MNNKLYNLDKNFRNMISLFLIVLILGVSIGLINLYFTTDLSPSGTVTRWNGSQENNNHEFEILEEYPKPVSEMLITTHNHFIAFGLIFGAVGFIFYFNSIITGFWKSFFIIEPFISIVVTFSSIWAMRFISEWFVYATILSAVFLYSSFFIMTFICLFELRFINSDSK